ncbi:MAG TPA: RelA/SpoT domain-containing protein [Clostridia bacterium]|nr:RelA/SpoT domain-containing protein [Clostridia bacterium]
MNEAELKLEFEARGPALEALGAWVTEEICAALEQQLGSKAAVSKFLQIPPKPRVKETDSFLEKALIRKPKSDPLSEITDQVGVRFVVLLLEDIDRIGRIVETGPWDAQKDRDFQEERLEKPDYFAYQSDHYVIRTRSAFEFRGVNIPSRMPCEIQIRTILQHAYAEMAHSSSYKPPVKLPEEDQKHVNRSLAKGSALIETTDDVFREIKDKLREYSASVDALLARSSEIYKTLTGETTNSATMLGQLVADTYRGFLKDVTPDQLNGWIDKRPWFGPCLLKKRNESVFYRDPIVILLGFLVTENETAIPKRWPVDSSHLEDFYTALGISTNGLF